MQIWKQNKLHLGIALIQQYSKTYSTQIRMDRQHFSSETFSFLFISWPPINTKFNTKHEIYRRLVTTANKYTFVLIYQPVLKVQFGVQSSSKPSEALSFIMSSMIQKTNKLPVSFSFLKIENGLQNNSCLEVYAIHNLI